MAKKAADTRAKPAGKPKEEEQTYEQIAFALKFSAKQAPVKALDKLTDKEKAVLRKRQLQDLHDKKDEPVAEPVIEESKVKVVMNKEQHQAGSIKDKREDKLESKRDFAIAKLIKEHKDEDKIGKKATAVQEALAEKIAKTKKVVNKGKKGADDDLVSS